MTFAQPQYFIGFFVALFVGAILFWRIRLKHKMRKQLINKAHFAQMIPNFSTSSEVLKVALIFLALIFVNLAWMRPRWGFEWREVHREGVDIFVALDVSKSMLTQDVKPNRLQRSKLAIQDLLKKLNGDRIGLIAFAGRGFLACPLTVDYSGFLLTLDDVDEHTIPVGGTAISEAIEVALNSYKDVAGKYKALVIITDGEDLEGDVMAAAKQAAQQGVKIFCVGMGTKEGELIRIRNMRGEQEFVKDAQGNFVKSRLNEELLEQIALATGGAYVRASGAEFGLDKLYQQRIAKMERRQLKEQKEKRYYERFQIPLAIAFLLLLTEAVITTKKRKK